MHSLQAANHMLNLIVRNSKEKIKENKIVKAKLNPFSAANMIYTKTDLTYQAGVRIQQSNTNNLKKQLASEDRPNQILKDTYTFFSVKKCKQQKKQNENAQTNELTIQQPMKKLFSRKSHSHKNSKSIVFSNGGQKSSNRTASKNQYSKSVFIKIQDEKSIIPKFLQRQQKYMQSLREMKMNQYMQKQLQKKKQDSESQLNTQRQNKLTQCLQNHINSQKGDFTYDIQGNFLLYDHENGKKAITKPYPPTIRYSVENDDQEQRNDLSSNHKSQKRKKAHSQMQFSRKQMHNNNHSIRGAKGQIFKSAVLKTINLSRISLGGHQDEVQFMKRNDLFNNNHCRQTTSIPFMKIQQGSQFKQTGTNQCISNKDLQTEAQSRHQEEHHQNKRGSSRAKSHQGKIRSQFKKYSVSRPHQSSTNQFYQQGPLGFATNNFALGQNKRAYPLTGKNSKNISHLGDSRYSNLFSKRPHTMQIGRIKRENQSLYNSFLQN